MTRPEVLLWTRLRRRQLGYQFRRQKPVGVYIVDFYCHELLLVVEVDGRCHDFSGAHDSKREAWLRSRGYTTLHLTGREVLSDLDGTVARVLLTCENLARRRDPLGK